MDRKQFLNAASTLIAAPSLSFIANGLVTDDKEPLAITPDYLKEGDIIGITSPAGYITLEEIQPAIQQMQSWGFNIKVGESIGRRNFTFGGTDEERASD